MKLAQNVRLGQSDLERFTKHFASLDAAAFCAMLDLLLAMGNDISQFFACGIN